MCSYKNFKKIWGGGERNGLFQCTSVHRIRVVIPASLQGKVLDEIHGGHLGVVKMKALACGHVWWPRIDQDIEFTKNCDDCRLVKHDPKLTPVHPWEFPEGPWRKLHIDFAEPFEGKQFLVAVDAFSK